MKLIQTLLCNLMPSEIEDINTHNFIYRSRNVGLDIVSSDYIYSVGFINSHRSTFIEKMPFVKLYFKTYEMI